MRVLLDTNVLVSGLRWPGPSHHIWEAAQSGTIRAFTSDALLRELRAVLTRPGGIFGLSLREYQLVERQIRKHCTVVRPKVRLAILADDPDNRVLECAAAGKVHVIVTGDKELLEIRRYEGTGS